jgi:hypothetical protein
VRTGLLVFDDFWSKPQDLVAESKRLRYVRSHLNRSNWISRKSTRAPSVSTRVARLARVSAVRWFAGSGTYRKTTRAEVERTKNAFFCHSDGAANFVSLLYLSPPRDCHGGTGMYRHLETGLDGLHDLAVVQQRLRELDLTFDELVRVLDRDAHRPRAWQLTDFVEMKHNRLVLYNGSRFHSHVFDFARVSPRAQRLAFTCFGETRSPW